jgi:uncharacterized protein (DUF934 family)
MPSDFRYRTDEVTEQPPVTLDAFLDQSNAAAVRLEPSDDARKLIAHMDRLSLIEIAFPAYRDGRGYSSARILREAGYTRELRAQGDVLVDQIAFMRRCGFDSFAPEGSLDPAAVERALSHYDHHYQGAADKSAPIWKLRHG